MRQASTLFFATLLALVGLLASCAPGAGPGDEPLAVAQGAVFSNGNFETGTAGSAPPSWTVQSFINNGITVQTPQTRAGLNLAAGGNAITTLLNGTNQPDPDLGMAASLRYCRYGNQCARVNFHSNNANGNPKNVNSLSQDMTIAAGDVDPVDNQVHIRFAIAPVLQNPAHAAADQPYYFVQVTNLTAGTLLYTDFNLSAQAGVSWKTVNGGTNNEIDYVDWTLVDVAPGPTKIAAGDKVRLEVIAAGCSLNGHFGEIYLDGAGTTVPGLNISGTGPTQANPGSLVTYALTYRNGAASAETGVTITLTTPPSTTFQSLTPPANATCSTLAVGATGTITCTISGSVLAGASSSFQYALNLAGSATGQLTFGSYDIHSNQETTLVGSKIVTGIGCTSDANCSAGKWCNISGNLCTATLANGTSIPSDPPHVTPTLNGSCTTSAATLVCTSTVCDTSDNKCGKANGSGACTTANQATICRSAVCDSDSLCGLANSHGPCSAANGATVCRSGSCSSNLLCQPAGGCNVDADCAGGNWCDETDHVCKLKLTNGTAIPSDSPHANPTLSGTCTSAAGSLVCQSLVCDTTDNKCGYATNGGPCTASTAPTVCRSGGCSANGACRPLNGCNVDADCTAGQWCAEATHVCSAKLANGTGIPSDAPHTNPALAGTCTVAAGALVCQAAVCDTIDDKCGKLNGSGACTVGAQASICRSGVCDASDGACGYTTNHGPCSALNAAVVCRSASCSSNLLCQPAGGCNVDADCPSGQWCNETSHTCSVKLSNGTSIPRDTPHSNPVLNGTCSADAATLVCQSAVCDASDAKCGYGTSDGPCTTANQGTVCRSGSCSVNGSCKPNPGCNVDADCTAGNWCNETLHACTATLANNTAIPTDAPHSTPSLSGTCTKAAAVLVCQSGVCDTADNRCGYDKGDGPCTAANGAVVCRSGACGLDLKCRPAAGCNVDGDCSAGNWCQESSNTCKSTLSNGSAVPIDAPHSHPTLDGHCTPSAGALVCQSAVCDAADDQCGLAAGHGPCTALDGASVCRSAKCDSSGQCLAADGCNVDSDCAAGNWCNETTKTCLPTLANGVAIPTDTPHQQPTLTGRCSDDAGTLVCTSGVCDTKDDECGLSNGVGPCSAATASTVCRSGLCSSTGDSKNTCVACLKDAQCSGTTPICNATSGQCVNCLSSDTCAGATPICDLDNFLCTACDGDNGAKSAHPCATKAAPSCVMSGKKAGRCAACATNDDCSDHAGKVCEVTSGRCVTGCLADSDCSSSEWCDDGVAMCTPKLGNGTPLPSEPARVATCTSEVGRAVCQSGVCDPADNTCGLAVGDGTCNDDEQCRAGSCDPSTQTCTGAVCTSNEDCASSEYCTSNSVCATLLPTGMACKSSAQCQSHDCFDNVCNRLVGSGNGVACSLLIPGDSSGKSNDGWPLAPITAGLAVAALVRKRRKRAA